MSTRGKHERWEMLADFIGIELVPRGWRDPVISGVGGLIGITAIVLISMQVLGPYGAPPIVASMGATAVLVFAVPHGPLSQPWPVFGGHVLSALVGVTIARLVPPPLVAGPIAVGLAIFVMSVTRSVHPPGGATALVATIAGPAVKDLGYQFVFTPVMLNAITILVAAFFVNLPFAWRRYPAGWRLSRITGREPPSPVDLSDLDLIAAMRELDTFIDVRDEDLIRIYQIARARKANKSRPS